VGTHERRDRNKGKKTVYKPYPFTEKTIPGTLKKSEAREKSRVMPEDEPITLDEKRWGSPAQQARNKGNKKD